MVLLQIIILLFVQFNFLLLISCYETLKKKTNPQLMKSVRLALEVRGSRDVGPVLAWGPLWPWTSLPASRTHS